MLDKKRVGKPTASAKKEVLTACQVLWEERELTRSSVKVVAIVESLSFENEVKWRIDIGDKKPIAVFFQDEHFAKEVISGKESIGKGDYLVAELETVQTLSPEGKMKIASTITKVHEHKPACDFLELL